MQKDIPPDIIFLIAIVYISVIFFRCIGIWFYHNSSNQGTSHTFLSVQPSHRLGFATISKRNKVKRVTFTVGIVITCFLFLLVYFRPDLFPFLSHSKFYQTISNFLPDKEKDKHPIKSAPVEISKDSFTEPREHSFSEEQILRAKKAVLEAQKNKTSITGVETPKDNALSHSFKDSKNRYEIQLLSGRYVYADSVIVTKDTITFENKKGLAVTVKKDEVNTLKRLQ